MEREGGGVGGGEGVVGGEGRGRGGVVEGVVDILKTSLSILCASTKFTVNIMFLSYNAMFYVP